MCHGKNVAKTCIKNPALTVPGEKTVYRIKEKFGSLDDRLSFGQKRIYY
jgi:hypothetical protein